MIKTKAIVLNRFPYKENDALVHFYTLDFGKVVLSARGLLRSSSKLAAHMEPFNFVDLMMIKNRAGFCVGSAISQNSFLNIKSSYSSLYLSGKILSFFSKNIKEGESDFDLFIFLNDFLKTLNEQTKIIEHRDAKELDFLADVLIFKLLKLLGYSYQTDHCLECGTKNNLSTLNFGGGGLLCEGCAYQGQKRGSVRLADCLSVDSNLLKLKNKIKEVEIGLLLGLDRELRLHDLIRKKIKYLNL